MSKVLAALSVEERVGLHTVSTSCEQNNHWLVPLWYWDVVFPCGSALKICNEPGSGAGCFPWRSGMKLIELGDVVNRGTAPSYAVVKLSSDKDHIVHASVGRARAVHTTPLTVCSTYGRSSVCAIKFAGIEECQPGDMRLRTLCTLPWVSPTGEKWSAFAEVVGDVREEVYRPLNYVYSPGGAAGDPPTRLAVLARENRGWCVL
eukprot:GHVS01061193.1.p1 GENE.GHVS01061193.1~~GHVS01061193.1.p1  ORF type:complete len:204 (-),score=13.66 GHVS01061193.1:198-809(-)